MTYSNLSFNYGIHTGRIKFVNDVSLLELQPTHELESFMVMLQYYLF